MRRSHSALPLIGHSARAFLRGLLPAPILRRGERSDHPEHLVVFSQVLWHDVWGRAQEIATRLADRVPVTYMSPTPVHRMLESGDRWCASEDLLGGRLRVRCPLVLPGEYKSGRVLRFTAGHVVREVKRLRLVPERTALFLNTPFVPAVVERIPWGLVVYDWHDDFAQFDWAPRGADALAWRTLHHSDLFTSGTRHLAEAKRTQCGEIHFLQNGVRFEDYAACDAPAPADLPDQFERIAGYIGTVGEHFDVDLIESVAREMPEVGFVLVGPVRLARPPRGDNIFALGLRPHSELPALVRHFDVGLIPFHTGPGSEAINPTKLLEYAAAGVPVVSTPLPDVVAMFGDCAAVASNAPSFAREVRRAIAGEKIAQVERARERARSTSWEAMTDRLWSLIDDAWEKAGGGQVP